MGDVMRYRCDCCGYYTLLEKRDYICPVCGWQEDIVQKEDPYFVGGANYEISLNEAKKNYKKYGVFNVKYINKVRQPLPEELPENNR